MNYRDEIVKKITKMAGRYGVYEIFYDWTAMNALAISNTVDYKWFDKREKLYLEIAKKYDSNELNEICELNGMLTSAMEEKMIDIMGDIYMNLEVSGKNLGQFFTPYHICQVMAKMKVPVITNEDGWIGLYEPAVGAGGNVVAYCEMLKDNGINYQEHCLAVCQDLDWKCVYMAYVQLSLYGIPAIVVQGDTLQEPWKRSLGFNERVFLTPMYLMKWYKFTNSKRIKEFKIKK